MHILLFVPALYAAFTFTTHLAVAQSPPATTQQDTPTSPDRKAEQSPTRIEVDEDAGVIRFFIEGQESMRLGAQGLHVRKDIGYGGTVTDYGPAGLDRQAGRTGEGRDEP